MHIDVTIEGTTPLLMNRFTEENESKSPSGASASPTAETPREQAEKKAYRSKDTGELEFPCQNIMACLIEAGRYFKQEGKPLTTSESSSIPAGLHIEGLTIPFGITTFEIDSRTVVAAGTGERVMCHRPRLDEWRLSFRIVVDDTLFQHKLVREIIDHAGKTVGLGDYRPQRKGSFGKFAVKSWEPVGEMQARAA